MDITFFTLASRNYLSYAATLMQSLRAVHPEARRVIGLVDAPTLEAAAELDLAAEVLPWDDLAIEGADRMRRRYSILELNTAVKPFMFQHLLGEGPVVYLDPDIVVYRRLEELERLLEAGAGLVLTPHITSPLDDGLDPDELALLRSGVYNLGFLAVGPGAESDRLLSWWAERLGERCLVAPEDGLFVDQRWMDFGPAFHRSAQILHHPGYNVAYWNLHERAVVPVAGETSWRVNGEPLAFFHFSGVAPGDPSVFSKHQNRFQPADLGPARALLDDYLGRLADNGWAYVKTIPYAYGRLPSGRPLHDLMRRASGDASPTDLEAYVDQADPDFGPLAPITRVMARLWRERADLQAAFDISGPHGRLAFLRWFAEAAERDLGLDRASVESALALTPLPAGGEALVTLEWQMDDGAGQAVTGTPLQADALLDLTIRLPALDQAPSGLSFRPLDRAGALVLHELRLSSADGTSLWRWQAARDDLQALNPQGIEPVTLSEPHAEGKAFLVPSADSRLTLPVGGEQRAALADGGLFVCRAQPLGSERLLQELAHHARQLEATLASSSWRVTKPLRAAKRLLGRSD